MAKSTHTSIPALRVRQWLTEWDKIKWSQADRRSEPQHWFYQFSISAADLKALTGVYPRTTKRQRGAHDFGIQRRHEKLRSDEISRFVKYGYPWSELSEAKRQSGEFSELRQPGWLPTAIVVNILSASDERLGRRVAQEDLIKVTESSNGAAELQLPANFTGRRWRHKTIPPVEVIDGQHRLWAFEDVDLEGSYELPVVAFVGLDLSWQAYLFYTINIKPKKINASLAFDLYPMLRTEEWLLKFEGHVIYRETRAQELVDLLWSHPDSPWYHRINMLGEKGYKGVMVTQAAWVRSLLASFVKSWEGPGVRIGGLFGAVVGQHDTVLPWSRAEQAAFLVVAGTAVQVAIASVDDEWAMALRNQEQSELFEDEDVDLAFFGPNTLLNQDQGLRVLLQVTNDLCYVRADALRLHEWGGDEQERTDDEEAVREAVKSLRQRKRTMELIKELAECLASYDWRASSAPGLTEAERVRKASFRGSGGYKELRSGVLHHLAEYEGEVGEAAEQVLAILGY